MYEESNQSNELFEVANNNNNATTERELSQKVIRIKNAINFLQYKNKNPRLSKEKLKTKLIELYGKAGARQVIDDVEAIKITVKEETANKAKTDLYWYRVREKEEKEKERVRNNIADKIIELKKQNQDIPDELFNRMFLAHFYRKGKRDEAKAILKIVEAKKEVAAKQKQLVQIKI